MFAAPEAFAHRVPAGLAAPGYSYWRALEITLSVQWYIVALWDGDGAVQRDLLVSWTSDLLSIIRTNRGVVNSVQLMEPAPARGDAPWRSQDLARIWIAASQAIAPVSESEGFLSALDLLRQVLLRLPSFMGLLLLGREVELPGYHTPASLAKVRIGVRRSAHNDPVALESEAREMIRRARAERQEAVDHYRDFANDLRQRMREGK